MSFDHEHEYNPFAYEADSMNVIDPQLEHPQLEHPQPGHPRFEYPPPWIPRFARSQLGHPQHEHPQPGHPQLEYPQLEAQPVPPRLIDPGLSGDGSNLPSQESEVSIREIIKFYHEKSPATQYITRENCGLRISDCNSGTHSDFPKRIFVGNVDNSHEVWMYMKIGGKQRCVSIPMSQDTPERKILTMGRSQDLDQVNLDASVAHLKDKGHNYNQIQRFSQLCLLLHCEHLETIRVRRKDFDFELHSETHRYLESAIRRHCMKLNLRVPKESYTHTRPRPKDSRSLTSVADRDQPENTNPPFGYTNDPPRHANDSPRYANDPRRYTNDNDIQWLRSLSQDQLLHHKREIENSISAELGNIQRRRREWNQARETLEQHKEDLDDFFNEYNQSIEREQLIARDWNTAMDAQQAQIEKMRLIDQFLNGG